MIPWLSHLCHMMCSRWSALWFSPAPRPSWQGCGSLDFPPDLLLTFLADGCLANLLSARTYLVNQGCWKIIESVLVTASTTFRSTLGGIPSVPKDLCVFKGCSRSLWPLPLGLWRLHLAPCPCISAQGAAYMRKNCFTTKGWDKESIKYLCLFFICHFFPLYPIKGGYKISLSFVAVSLLYFMLVARLSTSWVLAQLIFHLRYSRASL